MALIKFFLYSSFSLDFFSLRRSELELFFEMITSFLLSISLSLISVLITFVISIYLSYFFYRSVIFRKVFIRAHLFLSSIPYFVFVMMCYRVLRLTNINRYILAIFILSIKPILSFTYRLGKSYLEYIDSKRYFIKYIEGDDIKFRHILIENIYYLGYLFSMILTFSLIVEKIYLIPGISKIYFKLIEYDYFYFIIIFLALFYIVKRLFLSYVFKVLK